MMVQAGGWHALWLVSLLSVLPLSRDPALACCHSSRGMHADGDGPRVLCDPYLAGLGRSNGTEEANAPAADEHEQERHWRTVCDCSTGIADARR